MTRKEQKKIFKDYKALVNCQEFLMENGTMDGTEIQCKIDELVEKYFGLEENAVNPRNSAKFEQLMINTEKALVKLLKKK